MSGRPTTDVLILMVAGTICLVVLIIGIGVVVVELVTPGADTATAVSGLSGIVSTLIGLLAGFLAGRTARQQQAQRHDDETAA